MAFVSYRRRQGFDLQWNWPVTGINYLTGILARKQAGIRAGRPMQTPCPFVCKEAHPAKQTGIPHRKCRVDFLNQ
jgi:hypothetical protein